MRAAAFSYVLIGFLVEALWMIVSWTFAIGLPLLAFWGVLRWLTSRRGEAAEPRRDDLILAGASGWGALMLITWLGWTPILITWLVWLSGILSGVVAAGAGYVTFKNRKAESESEDYKVAGENRYHTVRLAIACSIICVISLVAGNANSLHRDVAEMQAEFTSLGDDEDLSDNASSSLHDAEKSSGAGSEMIAASVIDLREEMNEAGIGKNMPGTLENFVDCFVHYGSQERMFEHRRASGANRTMLENQIEAHHRAIKNKTYKLSVDLEHYFERASDVRPEHVVVYAELPLRVRGRSLLSSNQNIWEGSLCSMRALERQPSQFAFLTKEGTLKPIPPNLTSAVEQNGGILYNEESRYTTLFFDVSKPGASTQELAGLVQHGTVELTFTNLRWQQPSRWGYFRHDALKDEQGDCEKVRETQISFPENAPSYFVTARPDDNSDGCPSIAMATLIQLRLLSRDGDLIGSFLPL